MFYHQQHNYSKRGDNKQSGRIGGHTRKKSTLGGDKKGTGKRGKKERRGHNISICTRIT